MLNDREELFFAKNMLEKSTDLVLSALAGLSLDDVFERCISRAITEDFRLYVTSFSGSANKLSQWRSYANGGRGVSIGFSPATFEAQGFLVRQTTYGDQLVEEVIAKLKQIAARHSADPDIEKFCFRAIIETIASSKQSAFSEEDEVRLSVFTHQVPPSGVKYRTSGDFLIPYVEVDVSGAWPHAISQVWLGPMNSDPMTRAVVREFLNAHGLTNTTVSCSKTPLR